MRKMFFVLLLVLCSGLAGCGNDNLPSLIQINASIEAGSSYDLLEYVQLNEGGIADISIKEDGIDIQKIGEYKVVFILTTPKAKKYDQEFEFNVIDTTPPIIEVESPVLVELDSEFNPVDFAKAFDTYDGDITKDMIISKNDVDMSKEGKYIVEYSVKDSSGNIGTNEITVEVELVFSDIESKAIKTIEAFKSILKNPDSLQIHSIYANKRLVGDVDYTFKIDYSAQNSFGGMQRKTIYVDIDNNGNVDTVLQFQDIMQEISVLGWMSHKAEEIEVDKIKKGLN